MNSKTKKRFAILCRVSTERQGDKGESLQTQEKQLKANVKKLGGVIPKDCVYSGQEHSSGDYDRKILNHLLKDAEIGKYDAIMVVDASRLGRNSTVSRQTIAALKKLKIELYFDSRKIDHYSPEDYFSTAVLAEAAQLVTSISAKKSMENRIERAKRGWLASGTLPFGRRIKNANADKSGNAIWEVIPEDKKYIQQIYKLYVEKGLSFKQVAERVGGKSETIRKHLLKAGGTFIQKFNVEEFGIHEHIETKIPALLTDAQIQNVMDKAKSNRTFRKSKNVYPLAHRVYCANCGSTLSGMTVPVSHGTLRYYRHCKQKKDANCMSNVPAASLEKAVFAQLGQILKQQEALEKAIREALDKEPENKTDLQDELKAVNSEIKKAEDELDIILENFSRTILKGSAAKRIKKQTDKYNVILENLYSKRDDLQRQLSALDLEIPDDLAEKVSKLLFALTGLNGNAPAGWSDSDKQKLAAFFFGRGRKNENRLGVFVQLHDDESGERYFTYEMKGSLGSATGCLSDLLALNAQYTEEKVRGDISKRELQDLIDSISDSLPKNVRTESTASRTGWSRTVRAAPRATDPPPRRAGRRRRC